MITGHAPFYELNAMQAMMKIAQGHRPSRPLDSGKISRVMTDGLWELLDACWKQQPESRPSMSTVLRRLGVMMRPMDEGRQPAELLLPSIPSCISTATSTSDGDRCIEQSQSLLHPPVHRVRFNISAQSAAESPQATQLDRQWDDGLSCQQWCAPPYVGRRLQC
jgi:hypothetical protein